MNCISRAKTTSKLKRYAKELGWDILPLQAQTFRARSYRTRDRERSRDEKREKNNSRRRTYGFASSKPGARTRRGLQRPCVESNPGFEVTKSVEFSPGRTLQVQK